jgi:uncharacterized protein (TIGR03067 family)
MPTRVSVFAAVLISLSSSLAICAEPPARPAKLKELVGTWKVAEFVSKKAEWTPQEVRGSGDVATTKWILDGWFLEERKVPANGTEHLGIWHYDQVEKAFHYTMFQAPGGGRMDITIHWDDKTNVFNGEGQLPNGVTMRTATRFPDKNTKEWIAVAVDAAGKVYLDMSAKEVRADKELVKDAPAGAYVDEAAKSLQGFWQAQSYVYNGKAGPADLKQVWFDISGNKMRMKINGPEDECTFETDFKQSPKHLNIKPTGAAAAKAERKVVPAIYELAGDELKICFADTDKRPAEFSANEKSGQILIVLKREKR